MRFPLDYGEALRLAEAIYDNIDRCRQEELDEIAKLFAGELSINEYLNQTAAAARQENEDASS